MRRREHPPACPRHPDSKVWRDGTYGSAGARRQRFRCVPANGERPHRFTRTGATAPRGFAYTTRDVAEALVDVGRGLSYRRAAQALRGRTKRRTSVDGNAVADWVEIFAPLLYARFARERWPAVVVIDSLPFRARGVGAAEATAFEIVAALAPRRRTRPQLVALDVFPRSEPGEGQALWEGLLRSRTGVPAQIVCDPDPELVRAISAVWPPGGVAPAVFLCHGHLAHELLEILHAGGVDPRERLYRLAIRGFNGSAAWRRFLGEPRPRRLRALDAWLERYGERIAAQLAHAGVLTTTELLDEKLELLHERLANRRGNLRNRERTRRLLMLLLLELNGRADADVYEEILREELLQRGGRAPARRTVVDAGGPSLPG
jgi:hypothetical protein